MKHIKLSYKVGGLIFLVFTILTAFSLYLKSSLPVTNDEKNDFLFPMEENMSFVISELEKEGILAQKNLTKLVILNSNIKYEFSNSGISFIVIKHGWINPDINGESRKIEGVSLGQGSGFETLELTYTMENLDKGKKHFFDDPPAKETDKKLKQEVASNEEIREVVKKAETYEKKIKKIVETIK